MRHIPLWSFLVFANYEKDKSAQVLSPTLALLTTKEIIGPVFQEITSPKSLVELRYDAFIEENPGGTLNKVNILM